MCQYCGCQAIPAIKELTDEHDRALDHVREAESAARALDAPAAQVAAAALVDLLPPHLAVEEQALFPALADEFPDHVRGLLADHEVIEQVLFEIARVGPPADGWDTRLLSAMDLLRGHILREQDGVFPAALASLGPDEWDRLDEVRALATRLGHREQHGRILGGLQAVRGARNDQ